MFPITMSFTVSTPAELARLVAATTPGAEVANKPAAVTKDPKAPKPAEAKTAGTTAPTTAQETAPVNTPSTAPADAAPETKAEPSEPPLVYDVVAEKIRKVAREAGPDKARALLADFGVTNGQQLKPEQWPDVVKGCDALLKG